MKRRYTGLAFILILVLCLTSCGKKDSYNSSDDVYSSHTDTSGSESFAGSNGENETEAGASSDVLEGFTLEDFAFGYLYRAISNETGLSGIVNISTKEFTIPCEYDTIADLTPQIFEYTGFATVWVKKGDKWGAFDAYDGRKIYDFEFDMIYQPRLTVETNYLCMDENYFFQDISQEDGKFFENERCYVQSVQKDGYIGVVDNKGNVIVPFEYWLINYSAGRIIPIYYTRACLYHTMFDLQGNQLFELRSYKDLSISTARYIDGYIYVVDQRYRGFAYRRDGSCASDEFYGKDELITMPH